VGCCTTLLRQAISYGERFLCIAVNLQLLKSLKRDIYQTESPRALFKGLGPTLVGVIPARSINFFTYGNGKHVIANNFNNGHENSLVHLSAAAFAGIVTSTCTNPIWVVKTRMQLSAEKGGRPLGSWATIMQIARQEGVRGFYKGLSASYLGVTEGTIQWTLYERLKRVTKATEGRGGAYEWFGMLGSAGTAKFFASLVSYPHEVSKTLLYIRTQYSFHYAPRSYEHDYGSPLSTESSNTRAYGRLSD
jgi:solute carrier family 25, member 33/36